VGSGVNTTSNFVFQSSGNSNSRLMTDNAGYQIQLYLGAPNIYTYFYIPTTSETFVNWTNYSIGTFLRNGTQREIWQSSTNRSSTSILITSTVSGTNTMVIGTNIVGKMGELTIFPSGLSTAQRTALECNQANYYTIPVLTPQIALGSTNAISLGTTTASLPYTYTTATNYSITWSAAAASAGFVNVSSTLLPAASIPFAVPAVGPLTGQNYAGVLTVTNNCSGLSTNYGFNIYIIGNNVLDNLNLTAATPSAAAYGLRRLSSAYTGAGLQIRRSSDGEQRDVYFDATGALSLTSLVSAAGGGEATATTLSSWIGANSGTVSVWYDQSGLGRNAFQTTVAAQPRVINAGVIETQNGKPTLIFSGAQSFQTTATTTQSMGSGVNTTSNCVFQHATSVINAKLVSDNAGYQITINIGAPNIYTTFRIPTEYYTNITNTEWANYSIGTFLRNGTLAQVWNNRTLRFSINTVSGTVGGTTTMEIGTRLNGKMGELTIFPSGLSTAVRKALECSQAVYYNGSRINAGWVW
jgi:hypothetical protein